MIITTELAQPIVNKMMKVVDNNINIMNHEGIIMASGDKGRLYKKHQGAIEAIELKRERIIYLSETNNMAGTQPGVNLPIEFNREIIGTVGITGDPTKIYKLSHIVKVTVESLIHQQYLSDKLRYRQRAVEEWVLDVINPNYHRLDELLARTTYLNLNITTSCLVMMIEVKNLMVQKTTNLVLYEDIQHLEQRFIQTVQFIYPDLHFIASIGKGNFLAAIPASSSAVKIFNQLERENWQVKIGVSNPQNGIQGYRLGYFQSQTSLAIMKKLETERKISNIDEWGIIQYIYKIPEEARNTLVDHLVKKDGYLDSELSNTLESFFKNNKSIAETASELHIHRNTLLYRLEKIKQILGLDPRNFQDAITLQIINWCIKLR
ncbi:sugar diacid recognition domain-containing protein [Bacillus sp. FJAT-50079]|uniref:CdaR family transcriptional regulator n=1 Tax=Bacillus sp. FJAT-50079 TaxID=2833577 RepID=UPI001BCA5914|nr:sugar diacid recognition domain-containing protein [Bacillus sp. FJAT-50079]MBS4206526.1 helix-turn-helix domain-containing protein [Bacillus sp. FJAT-50079]